MVRAQRRILAGLLTIAILSASLTHLSSTSRSAAANALFQVDADVATPGVQTTIAVPPGQSFTVRWNIDPRETGPYQGYQGKMGFDAAVVNVVSANALGAICAQGQTCVGTPAVIKNTGEPDALGQGSIFAGEGIAATPASSTSFAGDVYEVELRCLTEGTSPLDLRPPPPDPLGQNTSLSPSDSHPTDTADGEVVCSATAPPPGTPQPPTLTPGPGQLTPTPTPPAVLPGPHEQISLAVGCNFEAWTGPSSTQPGTVAAGVSPQGSISGLWAQQPVPMWRGYHPAYPQASDMQPLNQLDVLAICMTGPGTFLRPVL
jgi:hypothetical protein